MVILIFFVRHISAFDYYEGIYWFCANTFENKMLQYFTETSESHVGYFQLWRHILRHLRHLLALCWKSHKPLFRLAQLIYLTICYTFSPCSPLTFYIPKLSITEGKFKTKKLREVLICGSQIGWLWYTIHCQDPISVHQDQRLDDPV